MKSCGNLPDAGKPRQSLNLGLSGPFCRWAEFSADCAAEPSNKNDAFINQKHKILINESRGQRAMRLVWKYEIYAFR